MVFPPHGPNSNATTSAVRQGPHLCFCCFVRFSNAIKLFLTAFLWCAVKLDPARPLSKVFRKCVQRTRPIMTSSSYSILTARSSGSSAFSLSQLNHRTVFLQCVEKRIQPTLSIVTASRSNLTVRHQVGAARLLHCRENLQTVSVHICAEKMERQSRARHRRRSVTC